jgi:hypothetical protein
MRLMQLRNVLHTLSDSEVNYMHAQVPYLYLDSVGQMSHIDKHAFFFYYFEGQCQDSAEWKALC